MQVLPWPVRFSHSMGADHKVKAFVDFLANRYGKDYDWTSY